MSGTQESDSSSAETVSVSVVAGGPPPTLVEGAAGGPGQTASGGTAGAGGPGISGGAGGPDDPGVLSKLAGDKRRLTVIGGGVAAIAVGIAAVLVATSGSSGSSPKAERQGTQIGAPDDPAGTRSGDPLGDPTAEQGNGAGGHPQSSAPAGAQGAPGSSSAPGDPNNAGSPTGSAPGSVPSGPAATSGHTGSSASGTSTAPGAPSQKPSTAPTGQSVAPPGQPTAPAPQPPAYGGRLGAAEIPSSASTSLTLQASNGSADGDTLLLSVMLTNTKSGGVGASDSAGNSYSVLADQTDGAGDRTLILGAVNAKALRSGGTVTLTFPSTQERHVALDAFHGVSKVVGHSSSTAASGSFASGSASAGSGSSIVFGVAGVQGGSNVAWSSGFTALPTLVVAPSDQLATAYEVVGSGSYQASGSCSHQWMAAVVTLA